MRIALDVRYRTQSGASTYIRHVVPGLLSAQTEHEFVLIKYPDQEIGCGDSYETMLCPSSSRVHQVFWDQLILPRQLRKHGIDLYHTLKLLGPWWTHCPQIRVCHSILRPYQGEFPVNRDVRAYWHVMGEHLYRNSDLLIAVSGFLKSYCVEALRMPSSKISVIHHGRDPAFCRLSSDQAIWPELPFQGPYVLTVGNLYPHKNHLTSVLAFQAIADKFPDYHLVMAGNTDNSYFNKVQRAIHESNVADRIHVLGHVDRSRVIQLLNHADLMLMPSQSEGFGIALVEAMSCGVPVIGSSWGAIPEVGGKAVHIVDDPFDIPAWASAVRELLGRPEKREWMRQFALERAADFSWERSVAETIAVYNRAMPLSGGC